MWIMNMIDGRLHVHVLYTYMVATYCPCTRTWSFFGQFLFFSRCATAKIMLGTMQCECWESNYCCTITRGGTSAVGSLWSEELNRTAQVYCCHFSLIVFLLRQLTISSKKSGEVFTSIATRNYRYRCSLSFLPICTIPGCMYLLI